MNLSREIARNGNGGIVACLRFIILAFIVHKLHDLLHFERSTVNSHEGEILVDIHD